jgi:GNAT superfamily N-acetyltransferase
MTRVLRDRSGIRILHTEDHDDEIAALDRLCFADGSAYPVELVASAECWVALDGDEVVGYAVAHAQCGAAYLDRYGVAPSHAGQGIGKRLLRTWLAWGRRARLGYAWTYTVESNAQSINALVGVGLRAWRPEWARPGYCVWRREL